MIVLFIAAPLIAMFGLVWIGRSWGKAASSTDDKSTSWRSGQG
jgi:hypothetical protein